MQFEDSVRIELSFKPVKNIPEVHDDSLSKRGLYPQNWYPACRKNVWDTNIRGRRTFV
ncbi:hypothetical protein J2Z66_007173 [Paenibacillus eucommiae]|uniref:Uncharacterized protein n=1 Tax=Paenibacillus eucommiae TaxID=1355755 RepID=A0ABS4J8Y2_9BACL|nr:hypothetical protein [Paenibacillus eucommiae]